MIDKVNGAPALAADEAVFEEPSPVVGARRCRISRPMQAVPDFVGTWGRAWAVDLRTARSKLPAGTPPDVQFDDDGVRIDEGTCLWWSGL